MIYQYWLNKPEYHTELLFECEAGDIGEADTLFENQTGRDPYSHGIGCQIHKGG